MNKKITNKKSCSKQGIKNPCVYVCISFEHTFLWYGYYDFAFDLDFINEKIKASNALTEKNSELEQRAYDELLNVRFRPTVDIYKFGQCVVNYLCSKNDFLKDPSKFIKTGHIIYITIDTYDDDDSSLELKQMDKSKDDWVTIDHGQVAVKSEIRISFYSKLMLLNEGELTVYTSLPELISLSSQGNKISTTSDDLLHWWIKEEFDNKEILWYKIIEFFTIIYQLASYEFIDIEFPDDLKVPNPRIEIIINDFEIASKYFEMNIVEQQDK